MSSSSYAVYAPATLKYSALIAHLTHPSRFGSASSIRNHLLAAYSSAAHWVEDAGEVERDTKPWDTLAAYRSGCTTLAVGCVPKEVLVDVEDQREEGEGPWAVLHVYAAPGSTPARVTLWLSTEPELYAEAHSDSSDSAFPEFESSYALLTHLLTQHLPAAVHRLAQHTRASAADARTAVLCAFEHRWLDFLETQRTSCVRIDWQNRCVRYYAAMDEQDAALLARVGAGAKEGDGGESVSVGRWECHAIRRGAEMELARASNKIPFPLAYVQARSHLSVCIRDSTGDDDDALSASSSGSEDANLYPSSRFKGAAAGFVYAHEELALAALHVTTPYRRLAPSSAGEKPPSVGRLLIRTMGPLLVRAQRRALKCAGVEAQEGKGKVNVTPVIADTEVANTAHGFFKAAGFVRGRENAWVGIALLGQDKQDAALE